MNYDDRDFYLWPSWSNRDFLPETGKKQAEYVKQKFSKSWSQAVKDCGPEGQETNEENHAIAEAYCFEIVSKVQHRVENPGRAQAYP